MLEGLCFRFQELIRSVYAENIQTLFSHLLHSVVSDINSLHVIDGYDYKLAPIHVSCLKGNLSITQLLLWVSAFCQNRS